MLFILKEHPKFLKMLIFILEKCTFFNILFRSWPEHGVSPEVNSFFGYKMSIVGPGSRVLPYNPNFGQLPVCSPQRDGSFPTLGTILQLFFLSYGRFRKKNLVDASKSLPPPHC